MRSWVSCLLALVGAACSSGAPARLVRHEVPSAAVPKLMAYEVWAPLDHGPDERLPLVVFLHGGGDSENSFDQHGVGQHLDEALAAGRIPRAVIVTPRGEFGFWENWADGSHRYRDWVVGEVMPAVEATYRTLPCPEHCHVAGVSMGGHGTLRFARFHPDRFASAAALSAPILSTAAVLEFTGRWFVKLFVPVEAIWGPTDDRAAIERDDLFLQWKSQSDLRGLRLMVAVAEEDRAEIVLTNREFHDHLQSHDIDHAYLEFPGGHKWVSWTPVIERVLRFAVWGQMEATGPPSPDREPGDESAPRALR